MKLWLYSLREATQRPGRSLLTLLSIILGVGTVFAVSTTIVGAQSAYGRMTEALSGKADAQVIARGGGRFAQDRVVFVDQAPGVATTVPLLHQFAVLSTGQRRVQINGIGTILAKEKMLHPFDVVSGRLLEKEGEIVLEESLARSAAIRTGDDLKILTRRGLQHVQVVGLIRPTEVWAFTQGGLAYFDLEEWQDMCKAAGKIDSLQIALAPTADKEKVLASLARQLPSELQLRSAHEADSTSSVTFDAFQIGLETSRTLAVIVAILLVLNTFLMNVTERRGQIAVLRLIGATRRQIMGLLLREGALVGLVGALLGLPLGWLLAHWLARGVESAFAVKLQNPEIALGPTLFAFAVGPVVAVIAALWPAYRASQVGPLESLRQKSTGRTETSGWKKTAFGALFVGLSAVGFLLAWARVIPENEALSAAVLLLLGLFFLAPRVLPPAYALTYRALRILGPMEFELAYRQMDRTQGRALLTWGILFIAVATSAGTGLILTDVINDIRGEVRRTTLADYIVRVTHTNLATGTSAKLPEGLALQVKQLPGVRSVESLAAVPMEIAAAGKVVAVVREFGDYDRPPLEIGRANPAEVRQKLLAGEIVISDILAYKLQKKAGDEVDVDFAGKTHTLRVAGTSPFFLAGGMAFFIDRRVAERKFGPLQSDALLIDAKPGEREPLGERLQALCQENGLLFQTYADVQQRLQNILNTLVASLWILLALGFLIAVFGVTNTLMMNVIEQTREIGLMRVLGMTRRQVRRMVLAQSAYVGLLAILPGLATSVVLAYAIRSTSLAVLGDSPHFGVLFPWLVPYALALMALVLLFGWLPSARAARLNIMEAIRTE
jgi:putative ABC transport system permease protein